VVDTESGRLLVKAYKPNTTSATIELEHAVLANLERLGMGAPRLRVNRLGSTWVDRDAQLFAVFDYLDGYRHPHEYLMTPADRAHVETLAGGVLGSLHNALVNADVPSSDSLGFAGWNRDRVRPTEWFDAALADAGAPSNAREWATTTLRQVLDELNAADLPRTVVHGDYGPYNLLLRSGKPPVVVDWELARIDWRLVDLAKCVPYFAQRRSGFASGSARRFLASYRDRTGMPAAELGHIATAAALLAVQRAVIAYTRARERGAAESWTDVARRQRKYAQELVAGAHPLSALARR
jgi:Ser/Thr protein kinase RdoA (MazF antagonist)